VHLRYVWDGGESAASTSCGNLKIGAEKFARNPGSLPPQKRGFCRLRGELRLRRPGVAGQAHTCCGRPVVPEGSLRSSILAGRFSTPLLTG